MIDYRQEALNTETQDTIRRLLNGEMFNVMIGLAQSQVKLHQIEALKASLTAATGAPLKIEASNQHMQEAARYATFIAVLDEWKNQTNAFVTVKPV
jgi:hypothetical protein